MLTPPGSLSEDVLVSALARCWPVVRAPVGFLARAWFSGGNLAQPLTTAGVRTMIVNCWGRRLWLWWPGRGQAVSGSRS